MIVFERPGGGRVKLPCELIVKLRDYIQNDHWKPEAGGVLLGRHIIGTSDIVIDKISMPMPGDKASRTTFFRKRVSHQAIIDKEWQESQHTCTYLGEWHTHPEMVPSPSCVDTFNWRKKLKKDIFDSESLFFVIVGLSEIRMWEGNKKTNNLFLLKGMEA